MLRSLLAAAFCLAAAAQDPQLAALHQTLLRLKAHPVDQPTPGADLTAAKHQLRDWIETQLASYKPDDDLDAFTGRLHKAFAGVPVESDDGQNLYGSAGLGIARQSGYLIVTTSVGILCQTDDSAFAYRYADGRWQRIWQTEQDDYSQKGYSPQNLFSVQLWQQFKDARPEGPPFILTLGNQWGCASTWHDVYYRVWRVGSPSPKLLIDGTQFAWFRKSQYAMGAIGLGSGASQPTDVLIEFTQGSVDATVHNREGIRHFEIVDDRVTRVDPVALSPRDFVDEWLTQDWKESSAWSASPQLASWHSKLHAEYVSGEFGDPTMHCQTPDLWQVTYTPAKSPVYFLVRWRPPYHFTMVDIADRPWPRCTEKDPDADQWRTLFNTQDWRW